MDNLIEQKKNDYIEKRRQESLARGIPNVEKLSDFECYLLVDGKRNKRVCGAQKDNYPEGYLCLMPAGFNTSHLGIGYCAGHDPDKTLDDAYWRRLNASVKIPMDIQELYERTKDLSKSELFSLSNIMKRIMVLYWNILNNPEGMNLETKEKILTLRQMQELRHLDALAMQIIESERKSAGDGKLKAATIDNFLQSIFEVITSSLPKSQSQLVMNRIMKITYTQHDEGNIGGDVSNIEKKVLEFEMKINEEESPVQIEAEVIDD